MMIHVDFRLLLWARKQQQQHHEDSSCSSTHHPNYVTWRRDKSFRSLVRLEAVPSSTQHHHTSSIINKKDCAEKIKAANFVVFSSLALEKNKRYSEQAAAAVAIQLLLGEGGGDVGGKSAVNAKRQKLEQSQEEKTQHLPL